MVDSLVFVLFLRICANAILINLNLGKNLIIDEPKDTKTFVKRKHKIHMSLTVTSPGSGLLKFFK